tara:strand:+ start:1163 stop:1276 length:114 start_codon:yes stop_codon:yes gene_type:complete
MTRSSEVFEVFDGPSFNMMRKQQHDPLLAVRADGGVV